MGEPIIVYGKSGAGKSRSIKDFAEDEIFLVNVMSKRLPFGKKFKYAFNSRDYNAIKSGLLKMPTKAAIIDDAGYLMTSQFMAGHSQQKGGASTFDLFNNIGDSLWDLFLFVKEKLPEDVFVYFLMHEQSNDYGEVKIRTIGKMLDEKVCVEGLATICLHCMTDGERHYFKTQGGAQDVAKSPEGMFQPEIENNLKAVDTAARVYWGLIEEETNEKSV